MQRSTYPTGETTASRIKSLYLYLEARHGRAEADALLSSVKLSLTDVEDETRAIGVAVFHLAVEAFVSRYSREELLETWRGVVSPSNLGVWMRVLRGTVDPLGAFKQLHDLGGEELRTARWETVSATPGRWHGRIYLTHDPRIERDGLLTLARQAELRAIPVMFGLAPGRASTVQNHRGTFASRSGAAGQEFVVEWNVSTLRRTAPIAAVVGAIAGASVGAAMHSVVGTVAGGATMAAACAGGAMLWRMDRDRRIESAAQNFRIRALERSMSLRDEQKRVASGFQEGTVIAGAYRLGAKLGTGASGVIHRAVRLADNTQVAVKLLRAAVAHDAIASDRLRREAEAMGLAWHPNVVELYDQGALPDGTTYLVMELLDGEALATRLKREKTMTADVLKPIALQLCDALGAVHAAGVIHRDVKPGNIFLVRGREPDTAKVRVKILDFGIARVEWAETRLTNFGAAIGTPGYMSPEQERGGEIDSRSDLYSLGAVLYECLTGIVLRSGETPSELDGDRRPSGVQKSTPSVPADWLEVIEKAMSASPRARYADAKTMRDALAKLASASSPPKEDDEAVSSG